MKKLFALWPELIGLPLAGLIFWLSPTFIQWIDPTASQYDSAVIQKLPYSIVSILVINVVAWMGIKFNFKPMFHHYAEKGILNDFKQLTPWQRISAILFLYVSLLVVAAILMLAI